MPSKKIKILWALCLIVIAAGTLALSIPNIIGIEKPFLLRMIVGICDIAATPILVFTSVRLYMKK